MSSQNPDYHGYRFPPQIISYAVWLYHRFCLSFRVAFQFGSYSLLDRIAKFNPVHI